MKNFTTKDTKDTKIFAELFRHERKAYSASLNTRKHLRFVG